MTMLLQPPDAADLCASGAQISTSTLLIVDTSDALSEIQERRLRATVNFERDRLPRGGKFTLLGLNPIIPPNRSNGFRLAILAKQ